MRRALALALLGLGFAGALGAQAKAGIGGELTGQRFSSVVVPIAVDMSGAGGAKLGSYTARLTWDPAVLNFNFVAAGNFPPPQVNSDSTSFGVLKFTSISPVGTGGLVTVAQMWYGVSDTISSPLTLSFTEMSAAGTYTNLLPGLTITNATFCGSRGVWGDIDRDGASNSRDALLVLSKVVGLPVDTVIDTISTGPLIVDTTLFDSGLGDVNADGNVTSVDALIILSTAVGIPIPGQRVLITAPGACATGSPKTLTVFPATAQLAVGQAYQLLAQGRDTAGRVVTLSNATWRSSNLNVAGVDADGTVRPRAAGVATITAALGPGITASASVTVAPRSKWYVDARVTGAPVQFGTAALPFDSPLRAFAAVKEGDTIAVATGTYDFVDYGVLNVGVVIQGGTPGDTTTRPLFRDAQAGYHNALQLQGGQRTVVQNVAFRNFSAAVDLEGVRTFALEDGKVESGNYGSGIYACANTPLDTVRVDRSVFLGDTTGDAMINDYCVPSTALVLVRDTKISGWGGGITWPDAESLAVVRSDVSDNGGNGVYVTQEYNVNPSLYIAHSRIARNGSTQIYGYALRRAVIDSSGIDVPTTQAIYLSAGCQGCGPQEQVAFHGDTITMGPGANFQYWLQISNADSLVMDQTVVQFPDTVSIYTYSSIAANSAAITRSQFLHLGGGNLFDIGTVSLFVDSVTATGCAAVNCDQATVFNPGGGEVGPQLARLTLSRSHFTGIGYPLYASFPGAATVTGNVIDSTNWGIELFVDSAVVTDNVLTRVVNEGLYVYASGGTGRFAQIARDSVSCAGTGPRAIDVSGFPVLVEDNVTTGCFVGIYAGSTVQGGVVRRNTIRAPVDGIMVSSYFNVTTRVDSNGVSGATDAGVYRAGAGRLSMTHNNISGNFNGVFIDGGNPNVDRHDLHDNSFTGNSNYAVSTAFDTVNAQLNWWGLSTGSHSGAGSDSTLGTVDATNFLTSAPSGLPGLAPRLLAAAPVRTAASRSVMTAAPTPRTPPVAAGRPAPAPARRPAHAFTPGPRMPAATIARIQEQLRRRAERDAREAARRSTRP